LQIGLAQGHLQYQKDLRARLKCIYGELVAAQELVVRQGAVVDTPQLPLKLLPVT
jgi:hypothetical protein